MNGDLIFIYFVNLMIPILISKVLRYKTTIKIEKNNAKVKKRQRYPRKCSRMGEYHIISPEINTKFIGRYGLILRFFYDLIYYMLE